MADLMQFDLVSPERRLASVQAATVELPGSEGDMTAMFDHAPVITTLRPGVLRVSGPDGDVAYFVSGGFADIAGPTWTVLADQAMPVSEVTGEVMDALVSEAEAARDGAAATGIDAATKRVADLLAAREAIGVSA